MSVVDLEVPQAEIANLGGAIRILKSAPEVDKGALASALKSLNQAKEEYADYNEGIGVEGKPYEAPAAKAEKKVNEETQKKTKEGAADYGKIEFSQQKKAAKKATAKVDSTAAAHTPPPSSPICSSLPPPKYLSTENLQIVINPNHPLEQRPVVALAAAVLTNTILDFRLFSDHRAQQTTMGLPNGGGPIVGDFAIARYIVRRASQSPVNMPGSHAEVAVLDSWIDYAQSLMRLDLSERVPAVAMALTKALQRQTYIVGRTITLADLCVFAALGFPAEADRHETVEQYLPAEAAVVRRWVEMMRKSAAVKDAAHLIIGVGNNVEAIFDGDVLDPLVTGMNLLDGGMAGRVTTRFPPEPSGYLHIGHAKAVLLNDYYARRYNGRLIVRFDDTNPSKEKEEFQQAIVEDLAKLGVMPDMLTCTSDYFGAIFECAKFMIEVGLAYMDDTPQEQMKTERNERKESMRRSQSPEEALQYFNIMCSGSRGGSVWCLRAKIDMSSDNGTMRDPVLFRQNTTPHHRTGTAYKAYPTYDLACPIVDSLEGVSHALRTTEYEDRNEQYGWIQQALNMRRVRIQGFSRVNFTNTVLSKRKLTWFVENGYVTGWDDARFPTVRGVVRRGINIAALRGFMYSQGASRRVVNMVWNTFWAENKKEIDKKAARFMAIDGKDHVVLEIAGAPLERDKSYVETKVHPKDPTLRTRLMRVSNQVMLETVDVEGIEVGDELVLLHWGVVKITMVGDVLKGNWLPDGDFKKSKKKLSWLAKVSDATPVVLTEFDNLISKEKLEEDDQFEDFINPNTLAVTDAIGDAGLKSLAKDEIIQLERRGYYRVDRPSISPEKPLILFMIPEGKSKAMSGKAGKLAHR